MGNTLSTITSFGNEEGKTNTTNRDTGNTYYGGVNIGGMSNNLFYIIGFIIIIVIIIIVSLVIKKHDFR